MNLAGDMFGVLYGKRFGSVMAWAIRTEGDRVGGGQSTETSCEGSLPGSFHTHLTAYEDGTQCSETWSCKIQTPGNHPKESIQHSGHGESLKWWFF